LASAGSADQVVTKSWLMRDLLKKRGQVEMQGSYLKGFIGGVGLGQTSLSIILQNLRSLLCPSQRSATPKR